jgi:hypothetical protein
VSAGVAGEVVGGFLPWIRSGQRQRNGFELVDAARTLDVLDSGVQRALAAAWYLVPLAAALCWLAMLLHRYRTAAGVAITTGLIGGLVAVSVEQAAIPSLVGVRTTLFSALAVVAGATIELVEGRRHELAHEPR